MAKSEAAQAAAIIRKQLKDSGIKASVTSSTYSGGNSVSITLTDALPATFDRVEQFASQFKAGSYNGMDDCYEYTNRSDAAPRVMFITVNREWSNDYLPEALDIADGLVSSDRFEWLTKYHTTEILAWNILAGNVGEFWTSRKPRVRVAA